MKPSRREPLENALRVLEEKFPQFRNADYQPSPTEVEPYRQYRLVKDQVRDAAVGEAFELFQGKRGKDLNEAGEILKSMGLAPSHDTDLASSGEIDTMKRRNVLIPSKNSDPEVAKRSALVRCNSNVPAKELCEIFDRGKVPLPSKWQDAGFRSWNEAYKKPAYAKRIRVLISKDQHRN